MQPTIDSASLKIQEGFQELLGISQKEALSMSMGIFVGIIETTLRLQGEDPSKTIDIEGEGEGNRSITIHHTGYVKPVPSFKELTERPNTGRFGAAYMHGPDLWCSTFQWIDQTLFELDENGEIDMRTDYTDCTFDHGKFFVEMSPTPMSET